MATHRIDLVDKDNAGRLFFGLLEHVTNAGRAHAYEHLDKVRAGDREKRHLGLAGNRLGEQGLTGSGLAHHEYAARDPAAQLLETTGIAQELNQLLHVLFGFLNPRHVGKGRGDLVFTQQLGFTLSKAHRAAAAACAALHLPHEEHEHRNNEQDREASNQQLRPHRLLLGLLALDCYVMCQEVIHQLGVFDHWTDGFKAAAILALGGDSQAIN